MSSRATSQHGAFALTRARLTILPDATLALLVHAISLVLGLHRGVVNVLGLSVGDSLPLPLLVEQEQDADLAADENDQDAEDDEDGPDTRDVVRRILLLEEEGSDDVSGGTER